MRSGPERIDIDEAVEWVAEESERRGKPIPIDIVIRALCLYLEFQLLVSNIAWDADSSDD